MRTISKVFVLLALLAVATGCRAQFVGYTSPQSVQQTLANNVNCTGAAQTFNVSNLGQTQHFATANPGSATNFQMVIQGLDAVGTVFAISDYGKPGLTGAVGRVSVQGTGYFPIIRVQVTCSPITATFVLNYSGASATGTPSVGSYQMGQIEKMIFSGAPANANQTDSQFQTPFGTTSGTLLFSYNTGSLTGSTLTLSCQGQLLSSGTLYSQTIVPASVLTPQIFQIPPNACPLITVSYTSGGATAGTVFLEYIFNLPGVPGTLTGTSAPQVQTAGADPCMGSANAKSFATVSTTASAQLIAGSAGKQTYVCSISLVPAGADNVALVEGTGAVCATGTAGMAGGATAATGWNFAANENMHMGGGAGSVAKTATAGDNVCLLVSAATQLSGVIGYVQQ